MPTYYREQLGGGLMASWERQKRVRDAIFARQNAKEEVEFVKLTGVKWKGCRQWVEYCN